jgi:uncharacterized membrane protein YoaK (UPF0700 family)
MIAKLPRWVWVGAALLAGIAGLINAVGFLSVARQGVTHLTGTTTLHGLAALTATTGASYWLYCHYRHGAMDAIRRAE